MAVRITTLRNGPGTVVRVEGNLDRDTLPELALEGRSAAPGLTLDLSGLRGADVAAVHTLRELIAGGAVVRGASLYVAQLLEIEEGAGSSSS